MSHHIRDFWGTLGEGPLCAVTSLGATPPKPWLTSTKPILDSSDVWAPESKTFFDKKVRWTREGGGLGQLLVFPVLTKRLADKYQSVLRHCLQPWIPTGAENAHKPWPRLTPLSRQVLSSLASDSLHRPSTWNTLDFFPCWLTPHSPQASGQLFFWRHPLNSSLLLCSFCRLENWGLETLNISKSHKADCLGLISPEVDNRTQGKVSYYEAFL